MQVLQCTNCKNFFSLVIAGGVALYIAIVRSPIRIRLKGDRALIVKISNRVYAAAFEHINREALDGYADPR